MQTIRDVIDRHAKEQPDKTVLIAPEPGLTQTFAQLKESCENFSRFLYQEGFTKGDKVSFMMGNSYQSVNIIIGAMYAGLVVAPVNLQAQPDILRHVLDHSDTGLVFTTREHKPILDKALCGVDRCIRTIVIDPDEQEMIPSVPGKPLPLLSVKEQDPALILYTSGTTGLPKGVILTHKNMVASGQNVIDAHDLTCDDVALCSLVLYHINALCVTLMSTIVCGATMVVPHKFRNSRFWQLISDYRCTWFSVVPTIISYLNCGSDIAGAGYHLDQLRFGRSASSALPEALHRSFEEKFGVGIVETMGLTETGAPILSNPMDPSMRKYGSPGIAVGNQVKIVDKNGNTCPANTVGEIMIKGDNVMKEYYKAPDVTRETLTRDGWLHSGDLAYMDEDGFVFVTGRLKELIIKGGENIAPREIDDVFYKHPNVKDAAAVGIPDEHYGEEIMVCVTLKPECECTLEELEDHCARHLTRFKIPKVIRVMDELPKGPSGKIQRLKLKQV
ncbi:MAG: AMP-binding protein [Desulfobacter sp.]